LVLAALIGASTLAGCDTRPVALLAGDSLAWSISDEVRTLLGARGYRVVAEVWPGSGLTPQTSVWGRDWHTRIRELERSLDPQLVIVVIGTNDALQVDAGEPYAPLAASFLAGTDASRVAWADCSTRTFSAAGNRGCTTIRGVQNAIVRTGFGVIDYNAQVASDPRHHTGDGIHLSQWGQDRFAQLIDLWVAGRRPTA